LAIKPALAATRAARILDFLSSHPRQVFTLVEIARATGVNAPSTLSVLLALTEGGYLVRDQRHKTYTLGPAALVLGQAAMLQHPVLEAARHELELLAREISAQCVGNVLIGDEIVAIVNEGRPRRVPSQSWVGTRVPYTAPFGACFAARADDEHRSRWLASAGRSAAVRARLRCELDAVRDHGFAVGRESPQRQELANAMLRTLDAPRDDEARRLVRHLGDEMAVMFGVSTLAPDDSIEVSYVSVPVLSTGEVVMAVTASGFGETMSGKALQATAARMQASAATISRRAFGVTPDTHDGLTRPHRRR
jgi:DNA-binding IclR family transcriptional regulator